jgi:serine/threonine protein kinase
MDGASFGHYRLLDSLGEGGMGHVFRAYDTVYKREVALKVLLPHLARDPEFERRFRNEADVAARLNEGHVIPIHSFGEIDGRLYVDMRLIDGCNLADVLLESGAMDPVRAVGIIEQVADALDAAHALDLIHRDIKPSNILLVGKRDFVYLIDFGLAQDVNGTRLTKTGATIGSFAYMAPERFDPAERPGPAADIYSLACVLYECLTGQLPFPGDNVPQQIAGHQFMPPPRPSAVVPAVSPAFDGVVAKGMAKNPNQRYPTVIALAAAARETLHREPPEVPFHARPTQLGVAQPAGPRQWPPGHGPGAPLMGPPGGGQPARSDAPPRQPERSRNFVAPGILIGIAGALRTICLLIIAKVAASESWSHFVHFTYNHFLYFLYGCCWLMLAVAFGLVAARCKAGERIVAVIAWLALVAFVLAALPWFLFLVSVNPQHIGKYAYLAAMASLIAFGIAAHRPFGKWWSVPAVLAGIFGLATNFYHEHQAVRIYSGSDAILHSGVDSLTWTISLLALGIAMSLTGRKVQSGD